MPQTKSAAKHLRQTKKRSAKNKRIKENLNYIFRQFKKALSSADKAKTEEFSRKLIKALDKAAQKRVIKPRNYGDNFKYVPPAKDERA